MVAQDSSFLSIWLASLVSITVRLGARCLACLSPTAENLDDKVISLRNPHDQVAHRDLTKLAFKEGQFNLS